MPTIEYSQGKPTEIPQGVSLPLFQWTPSEQLAAKQRGKSPEDDGNLVDYDLTVRLSIEHTSTTTGGVQIQVWRSIGTYRERTHNFRLENQTTMVEISGPLTTVNASALSLGGVGEIERVTVNAIARAEGR